MRTTQGLQKVYKRPPENIHGGEQTTPDYSSWKILFSLPHPPLTLPEDKGHWKEQQKPLFGENSLGVCIFAHLMNETLTTLWCGVSPRVFI